MDTGGLERLHEAGGQPDRDAVPQPHPPAPPGYEAQRPRVGQRPAIEVAEQRVACFLVTEVRARIHVAVADAMLQRNAPLPASVPCGGAGVGSGWSTQRAGDGERTVAG